MSILTELNHQYKLMVVYNSLLHPLSFEPKTSFSLAIVDTFNGTIVKRGPHFEFSLGDYAEHGLTQEDILDSFGDNLLTSDDLMRLASSIMPTGNLIKDAMAVLDVTTA